MDPKIGGPAQGIRNLDSAMQDLGVIREVVSLDDPDADFVKGNSFIIHAIGRGRGVWQYLPKLTSWLEENIPRFDVVVVNGLWLYPSFATWQVFKQLKKRRPTSGLPKFFVMPHGMLDPYFQKAAERRFKAIRNWLYWKLIECKVVNDADCLLFTCKTELELARTTFTPYHPKKEFNAGYGILAPPAYHPDMSRAFSDACQLPGGDPYWLFLSRIHPKKGVDILVNVYIKLFNEATSKNQSIPKLIIAGPGMDTSYGSKVKLLVKNEPEVANHIIFLNMLQGDGKWGAFYGCEVFILPSHQENFGIAVAEALACGKPVLISNQVNIWQEIESGGAGIIGSDDVVGLEQTMHQWLNMTTEQKVQMSNNAKKTYEDKFDIVKVSTRYLEVFKGE
jgi:glycosyltransferase involved in cell wall biosynthesis